jgi:hypothetical protein
MSKLAVLNDLFTRYQQLNYHQNPQLLQRLRDVQQWQKQRIQRTHAQRFNEKQNILMAEYFMNRLYGGPDFDALAQQIERLLPKINKAEKLIPENAVKTGTAGIQLAILAVQLDEQIAAQLLADYPADLPLSDEIMRLTYLKLDQGQARLEQLRQLDLLGQSLDKYLRSFVVHTAFKMCKSVAYKHRFDVMYDFMQDGFVAMKPLKSAEKFVNDFTAQERGIVAKVHAGDLHPFA